MAKVPHTIAIIPARGGSKRIPGKNIRPLAGRPLIEWSIQASLDCPEVARTIVSTDDEAIAEAATRAGAEIHLRSPELATDLSPTLPVLQDVVAGMEPAPDLIALLQPTSPFRPKGCISKGLRLMAESGADSLIAVSKCKASPAWMLKEDQGWLDLPHPNDFSKIRSQDLGEWWRINGALYIYTRKTLMEAETYAFGQKTLSMPMESPFDLDIDTPQDFNIAEAIAHADHFDWK